MSLLDSGLLLSYICNEVVSRVRRFVVFLFRKKLDLEFSNLDARIETSALGDSALAKRK